ncbi:MAG: multidrug transporter subunit MdtC [Acidobacteria bacterium]|nr:MAG: multidrug transporter subunit MdtC [Acidobacteria bacterium 13_2_20CM_58_27]PYT87814.1 MAG: multidrug transporter subunit MdtC [Acidobacteriota bacterium]
MEHLHVSSNFSAPFIRRPVATSLITVAILLSGVVAFRFLPVAPLPQVDFPTISVGANLPGASPVTMASAVATPLERQFGRIAGVTQMTSSSGLGSTNITLQFELNRDINAAARDVQAAINAARSQLPADLPSQPNYRKVNPADSPILMLALTSDNVPPAQIYDAADSILAQKLAQVEGVGQVFTWGSARPAVRVEANPDQLNSYGISLEQIRKSLQSANANLAKGLLSDNQQMWFVAATDQLFKAYEYEPLIVAGHQGAPVRLRDISEVVDSVEDTRNLGLSNGKRGVLMAIFRQPGANMIDTVDRIMALLPLLRASISPSLHLTVAVDRTTTIRSSVRDVEIALSISILLVVFVVFAFLRNVWATIIPSVAVPLSLIGTFGVMYLCNYSLDNLSLMALTISTGFVVDDAIVVIENITRHIENGMKPFAAAMKGASEIGFTVLSMSTSLVAVFIPILMMGGIVGRLFREFAVVLSVAIGVSLFVSLTTTPMMCARFLRHENGQHNRLYRFSEGAFNGLLRTYDVSLRWVLRHQFLILLVTLGTVCLNLYLFVKTPKGFFPQQDTGRFTGLVQGDQDLSFAAMSQKMRQFTDIVMSDPAVESVTSFTGGGSGGSTARMFGQLKPLGERKISVDQVIARIRAKTAKIPGAALYLQAVQDLSMGGRMGGAQYQYTLQADNLSDLTYWAPILQRKLATIPELRDVNSDQQLKGLQSSLVIDRDTASRLGVAVQDIDNTLGDAFGQRQVSNIYKGLNQYHVVLEVAPEMQRSPEALKSIYVPSNSGKLVPLSAFAHYEPSNTALSVNHQGIFPAITLSFNLAPGASLGPAVDHIEAARRELKVPNTVHATFQGTAQAFQDSLTNQKVLIITALAAVYIVLGILYESFIHPITILSTIPSAGIGALLAIQIIKSDLNIIALIGIILLIGIVKKNAILMIDFAVQVEREENKSPVEAIYKAGLLRFRPILMTTMAALLGAMPLALGSGVGSELRRPLGITIVGGLILSQMLTLFTTPVVYIYMDRLQSWLRGAFGAAPAPIHAPAQSD